MDQDVPPVEAGKALRKQVYFDMSISGISIGRMVFELWFDKVPKTCENFRCLCTGEKGVSETTGAKLHYKNTLMHRVIKGFMVQGGDFTKFNGTGGESIYGGRFEDEDLTAKHDRPGLLSMANAGKDTNGSQFFITVAPAPHLDGNHVVFGRLLSGKSVLRFIEREPVVDEKLFRPGLDIKVDDCGELSSTDYVTVDEFESSSIEKKEKKRRRRSSSSSSSDSSTSSDDSSHRRKSRHKRGSKPSKKSKYREDDDRKSVSSGSALDRGIKSEDAEKSKDDGHTKAAEPAKPRVDSKGREVRGRGVVSENRRFNQQQRTDRRDSEPRYSNYGRSDYHRRENEGRWRRGEESDNRRWDGDRDERASQSRRDGDYYDRESSRSRDRADDAGKGDHTRRTDDFGRSERRPNDDRNREQDSYRRDGHSNRSEREERDQSHGNGETRETLPPRTLVSYSAVVAANAASAPTTDSIDPKEDKSVNVKPVRSERAASPEQIHQRRPSSPGLD